MAVYKLQQKNSDGNWVDVTLGNGTTEGSAFISASECCCGFAWIQLSVSNYGVYKVAIPINYTFYSFLQQKQYNEFLTQFRFGASTISWPVYSTIVVDGDTNLEIVGICAGHVITKTQGFIHATYENNTSFLFTNHF